MYLMVAGGIILTMNILVLIACLTPWNGDDKMVEKLNPLVSSVMFMVITWGSKVVLGKIKEYSELSDKHTANLILILSTYIAYRFIYFQGKFPPTRLLEPPRFGRFLSSFKLLFRCFKQLKVASKSFLNYV